MRKIDGHRPPLPAFVCGRLDYRTASRESQTIRLPLYRISRPPLVYHKNGNSKMQAAYDAV